ncbi:transposase, partial [Pseudomonas sp. BGM005]|nr:transposase [Pseudomonas sp. BG5]
DEACLDYLDWLRWPDGFEYPRGGHRGAGTELTGRYRCRGCRTQVSVTSGTIYPRTRTPLTVWFDVAAVRAEPDVYGQVASDPTISRLFALLA